MPHLPHSSEMSDVVKTATSSTAETASRTASLSSSLTPHDPLPEIPAEEESPSPTDRLSSGGYHLSIENNKSAKCGCKQQSKNKTRIEESLEFVAHRIIRRQKRNSALSDYEEYFSDDDFGYGQQQQQRPLLALARWALAGGFVGGALGAIALFLIASGQQHQHVVAGGWDYSFHGNSIRNHQQPVRGRAPLSLVRGGIESYLSLFQNQSRSRGESESTNIMGNDRRLWSSWSRAEPWNHSAVHHRRKLSDSDDSHRTSTHDPMLVIAGKMSVEDSPCNIAQYNMKTNEWSLKERIQLSLYNSYSGGEVYSLLANHSTNVTNACPPKSRCAQTGSGELIIVGAFDTTFRTSQVTYCSVGKWNGLELSKVGEGLCNSALLKGMKITTAAFAGPHELFVAGSFQTQVYNGSPTLAKVFNIAHFNAKKQLWLPLNVGQITCSWCTVTVLSLAWDSKRRQLHVAGKFNAIDQRNVPAGLAIYDYDSGHLVAHPGGGLAMMNMTQDGVGTALQLDEEAGVLYVMGSFERLTATNFICKGLAAYEIEKNRWTCLANAEHTVLPTGGGNMLLTPHGLMVAGKVTRQSSWQNKENWPYTIALLTTTLKTRKKRIKTKVNGTSANDDDDEVVFEDHKYRDFNWNWLPGFNGHDAPLHALSNGFGEFEETVFIAGDNLVAKWSKKIEFESEKDKNKEKEESAKVESNGHNTKEWTSRRYAESFHGGNLLLEKSLPTDSYKSQSHENPRTAVLSGTTEVLSEGVVRGAIMSISQMLLEPEPKREKDKSTPETPITPNITIIVYCISSGCVIGVIGAILCNRNISKALFPWIGREEDFKGFSLDTLTYSTGIENTNIFDAYSRAMESRHVHHHGLLTIIDPKEIFLKRIIGEGSFGRVWSAKWRSASVAVKEFVFAQAAVAGRSTMQQQILEEIIGEAGMMAILRHPNVLQLFGCSLTAQAIWIVSELCSLGSLRQYLDAKQNTLSVEARLNFALQIAEGMCYLHTQDPTIIHRDLKSHNILMHETFAAADSNEGGTTASAWDRKWERKSKSDEEKKLASNRSSSNPNERTKLKKQPSFDKMVETESTIVAKIGDWGSARATLSGSRTMTHGIGTACWLAPEVIKYARSSKKSDVYSYAIILWELATRKEVYKDLETTQIIAMVANENLRPTPVPEDCPWKDIMVKCWAENPRDRLTFSEIARELNDLSKVLKEQKARRTGKNGTVTSKSDSKKK